jgi:hypothetical protein
MPATYLIDRNGVIRYSHYGFKSSRRSRSARKWPHCSPSRRRRNNVSALPPMR